MNVFQNFCRVQLSWIIYKDSFLYEPDVCAPPAPNQVHVETLIPSVTVFGGGVFERGLAHENEALVNEISALIKRLQRVLLCLLPSRRQPSMNQHVALT